MIRQKRLWAAGSGKLLWQSWPAQIQLEQGEAELKKGMEEFEKARENLSGADLNKILIGTLFRTFLWLRILICQQVI